MLVSKSETTEGGSSAGVDLSIVKHEPKTEVDIGKLSLYPAKTIAEVIDLTLDPDSNLYIKVEPNQTFHNVLTSRREGFNDLFAGAGFLPS